MNIDKLIHRRAEKYVSALQDPEMKSHVPLETGNPGRPLTDSTPASGHIHLRVTMERKNRYVRAARNRKMKLSEWMTETCDTASGLVTANDQAHPTAADSDGGASGKESNGK